MIIVRKNEATAARRRVYFHLVDVIDGMTPETGEASGQPQISVDGASFTNTGIGTLTAIGNGRYYAELTQAITNSDDIIIETRYKSANTAECPGSTVQVLAQVAAISAVETTIGTAGAGLTSANIGQAALEANNLDHLCKTATAAADMTTEVADNTILARALAGGDTSTFNPATAPLKLLADIDSETDRIKDGGDLDAIIDNIKTAADEANAHAHSVDGKLGTITNTGGTATVGAVLGDFATTNLHTRVADLHTDVGTAITDVAAVKAETVLIVADTGELQTDWAQGGRLDLILDAASSAGDPWNTPLPGAYGSGKAGYILGTNLAAVYGSTEKSAIDLLDDADGGLGDVHTVVNGLATSLGTPVNTGGTATIAAILGDPANVSHSSSLTSLVARVGAWTGTGVNTLLGAFKALLNKAASAPSDIGGTFDPAMDSTEALRDRGDAAYLTATGFMASTAKPTVGGYDTGQDPATLLLVTPANKLATDASGHVTPDTVTPETDISGLATKAEVLALSPVTAAPDISHVVSDAHDAKTAAEKVSALVETDGGHDRFKATALETAPSAPTAADNAAAVWEEAMSAHTDPGSAGAALSAAGGVGAGAITWTYTLTESDTTPIADADVWVTTDSAGSNVIASGRTNALGVVTFLLDAGTVYVWASKSGYNFVVPDTEVVA